MSDTCLHHLLSIDNRSGSLVLRTHVGLIVAAH